MDLADFNRCIALLGDVAFDDIEWAENIQPPSTGVDFACESIFVICNSGMAARIARSIYVKCTDALFAGASASTVFGHAGKTAAMDHIWEHRDSLLEEFLSTPVDQQLEWLERLPWIGGITRYHLAKNLGVKDYAKPDVHLRRISERAGMSVQEMCEELSRQSGYKVATVDTVIWRACSNGILNSNTGEFKADSPAPPKQDFVQGALQFDTAT